MKKKDLQTNIFMYNKIHRYISQYIDYIKIYRYIFKYVDIFLCILIHIQIS